VDILKLSQVDFDWIYPREDLEKQLGACLSYAARAASINFSRVGGDPPDKHELE